jgi:hypothetical protein
LGKPTGTKQAATLTQAGSPFGTGWSFQPVPKVSLFFPKPVLFQLFITIYACRITMRTQAIRYYTSFSRVYVKIVYENN